MAPGRPLLFWAEDYTFSLGGIRAVARTESAAAAGTVLRLFVWHTDTPLVGSLIVISIWATVSSLKSRAIANGF